MVLPVRHMRVDDHRVAVESPFAEHLRMMRAKLPASATALMIASPGMTAQAYEAGKQSWAIIDEDVDKIGFVTLFSDDSIGGSAGKLKILPRVTRTLRDLAKNSICVHSGLSWDVWLPFEFLSILVALTLKRPTVFVVDIDYRKSAYMSWRTGVWSRKSYLICKNVYDRARSVQVSVASRFCSLVLLKGKQMAEDFGRNRPAVKDFIDASHSESNIIDAQSLELKLAALRDTSAPLKLIYFGRLVAYKGIDRCITAVANARRAGANVTFHIVGGGDQDAALRKLTADLAAEDYITFAGFRPFNQEFFRFLYEFDILLAAPLREDTPRSAIDAMAAGIPFLAFDTYYYKQLAQTGAGSVVPWPDEGELSRSIVALSQDRERVAKMVLAAVTFAQQNTQEIWLDRRLDWTFSAIRRP